MAFVVQHHFNSITPSSWAEKWPSTSAECTPNAFGAGKHPKSCAEGAPEAFQTEKHLISCAEGAPKQFRAEKGIFSCAKWDTHRLPSRETPHIPRRRCPGVIPGRNRYHFRREMRYPPPPAQENTPNPAQKVPRKHSRQKNVSFPAQNVPRRHSWQKKVSFLARKIENTDHKSPQHQYFSVFDNFAFLKKNS